MQLVFLFTLLSFVLSAKVSAEGLESSTSKNLPAFKCSVEGTFPAVRVATINAKDAATAVTTIQAIAALQYLGSQQENEMRNFEVTCTKVAK